MKAGLSIVRQEGGRVSGALEKKRKSLLKQGTVQVDVGDEMWLGDAIHKFGPVIKALSTGGPGKGFYRDNRAALKEFCSRTHLVRS